MWSLFSDGELAVVRTVCLQLITRLVCLLLGISDVVSEVGPVIGC
jgi:hypothetical protein